MIWTMVNSITSPPTTPPMMAPVRIPVLFVKLELEVGDEALVVEGGDEVLVFDVGDEVPVDVLDGGKRCLNGAKESYLVPPSTRNTSKDSRRTRSDSEL